MSIVLKDVGYVYSIGSSDEKTALHDINLDIKENEPYLTLSFCRPDLTSLLLHLR